MWNMMLWLVQSLAPLYSLSHILHAQLHFVSLSVCLSCLLFLVSAFAILLASDHYWLSCIGPQKQDIWHCFLLALSVLDNRELGLPWTCSGPQCSVNWFFVTTCHNDAVAYLKNNLELWCHWLSKDKPHLINLVVNEDLSLKSSTTEFHPLWKFWFFQGNLLSKYISKYMFKFCIMCFVLNGVSSIVSLIYAAAGDTVQSASTIFKDFRMMLLFPLFQMSKALVHL